MDLKKRKEEKKNKALIKKEEAILFDPNFLEKAEEYQDFVTLWMLSKELDIRNQWFKGDIASKLTIKYGEKSLVQFAKDVGESAVKIEHYRRVARAFPSNTRNLNLSWTHYFIASFTDSYRKKGNQFSGKERYKWLQTAHDEAWSTTELADKIKKANAMAENQGLYKYYVTCIQRFKQTMLKIEKNNLSKDELKALSDDIQLILQEINNYFFQ